MPLFRYFVFVGGTLLALLFVCDALLPQVPLPVNLTSGSDLPAVRIRSDRKWPERVVFDTNVPPATSVKIASAESAAPVTPAIAEASAKARVRDAFAQAPQAQSGPKVATIAATETGKVEAKAAVTKPQAAKRKVARARPAGRPVMLVAQQPHFGLFETTW